MGIIQLDRTRGRARCALSPSPSGCPFAQMPPSLRTGQAAGGPREVVGGTPTPPCRQDAWWGRAGALDADVCSATHPL